MNSLEERIGKIEGIVEQIDERLNSIDKRFEAMDTRLNHLSEKIDNNFKLTVRIMLGILIPMWVTIIGSIIALFVAIVK